MWIRMEKGKTSGTGGSFQREYIYIGFGRDEHKMLLYVVVVWYLLLTWVLGLG